jgi:membrane associated rhomboid family serine protease
MFWLLPWDEDASVRHLPWATWTLVLLNCLAFAFNAGDGEAWITGWGLNPAHPQWQDFISSNFAHAGIVHLVGNMLFLLLFGDNVEDVFGPLPFLGLYFLGGLLGDWWFVSANASTDLPSVGASGCIATLAGAYGLLFFREEIGVKLMFLFLPVHTMFVRAPVVLAFYFGLDLVQAFVGHGVLPAGGGTNFVVHAAGFVVGVFGALLAVLCGVTARYHGKAAGHALLGYWSAEAAPRRRKRSLPRR